MKIKLTDLEIEDYGYVKGIYDHYILNSTVTFHKNPVNLAELKKIVRYGHSKYKSFTIRMNDQICGFCYLSPFKNRPGYDRTAEVTIYLKPGFQGQGIGTTVLEQMDSIARDQGISVLVGYISEGNKRSIMLFENCGYEKCAHFKDVGEKFGQVLDVLAYQKNISWQ